MASSLRSALQVAIVAIFVQALGVQLAEAQTETTVTTPVKYQSVKFGDKVTVAGARGDACYMKITYYYYTPGDGVSHIIWETPSIDDSKVIFIGGSLNYSENSDWNPYMSPYSNYQGAVAKDGGTYRISVKFYDYYKLPMVTPNRIIIIQPQ